VNVSVHEAWLPVPVPSVHVPPFEPKVPLPLLVTVTEPVGLLGLALESFTVAVQLVCWALASDDGMQTSVVDVARWLPVTVVAPLLEAYVASPP
jgi:hypothetical protein